MDAEIAGRRPCYEADGFVITDDGEVIGLAEEGQWYELGMDDPEEPGKPARGWRRTPRNVFIPDDPDKADWVLEKLLEAESRIVGVREKKKAILERLEAEERAQQRRADFLRTKYGPHLERVAKAELRGKRSRTLKLTHGQISLRMSAGTNKINDADKAVAFVESIEPNLLTLKKSVNVTNALRAIQLGFAAGYLDEAPDWMESTGPRETCSITTGIKL